MKMRTFIILSSFCWILSACADSASTPSETPVYVPFGWENEQHFCAGSLGDTLESDIGANHTRVGRFEWNGKLENDVLQSFEGNLYSDSATTTTYNELQDYYNSLFNAQESDADWSYWDFEVNDQPAELYLLRSDSNRLEIRGSILSYR